MTFAGAAVNLPDTSHGPAVPRTRFLVLLLAALFLLRGVAALALPLSFDEAFYWLWSKDLQAGYVDHPPMIAIVIRAGTLLFGDTVAGVRAGAFVLSLGATWAVWRSAAVLLGPWAGGLAALLFNLPLVVSAGVLVATPDAPAMAAAAVFLLALAKVAESGRGSWWLAVGVAGGLALLSKYTAVFLGLAAVLWLIVAPAERRWLRSAWPYAGALVALVLFLPNLLWNLSNDWASLGQHLERTEHFGRLGARLGWRYLAEFVVVQSLISTPFVAALGVLGLARRSGVVAPVPSAATLLGAMIIPAFAYYALHSLTDHVYGNWTSSLFPAVGVAAARGWRWPERGPAAPLVRLSRALVVPVAVAVTVVVYVQATVGGLLPPGRNELTRLLAIGYEPVAEHVDSLRVRAGARGVLTASYPHTGWLAFYLPSRPPVMHVNDRWRWRGFPVPAALLAGDPLLYVARGREDPRALLRAHFDDVTLLARIPRVHAGAILEEYSVYRVARPTRPLLPWTSATGDGRAACALVS